MPRRACSVGDVIQPRFVLAFSLCSPAVAIELHRADAQRHDSPIFHARPGTHRAYLLSRQRRCFAASPLTPLPCRTPSTSPSPSSSLSSSQHRTPTRGGAGGVGAGGSSCPCPHADHERLVGIALVVVIAPGTSAASWKRWRRRNSASSHATPASRAAPRRLGEALAASGRAIVESTNSRDAGGGHLEDAELRHLSRDPHLVRPVPATTGRTGNQKS